MLSVGCSLLHFSRGSSLDDIEFGYVQCSVPRRDEADVCELAPVSNGQNCSCFRWLRFELLGEGLIFLELEVWLFVESIG